MALGYQYGHIWWPKYQASSPPSVVTGTMDVNQHRSRLQQATDPVMVHSSSPELNVTMAPDSEQASHTSLFLTTSASIDPQGTNLPASLSHSLPPYICSPKWHLTLLIYGFFLPAHGKLHWAAWMSPARFERHQGLSPLYHPQPRTNPTLE